MQTKNRTQSLSYMVGGLPAMGEVVLVTRRSGQIIRAKLGHASVGRGIRDVRNLHWLTERDKFANLGNDPIVNWRRIDDAS